MFTVLLIELIELVPLAVLAGLLVVIGLRLVKLAGLHCARRQGELTRWTRRLPRRWSMR